MYKFYFIVIALAVITVSLKKIPENKIYTGTTFNIAYHQLKKDAFNYSNSDYPELRREYALIFNNYNQPIIGHLYKATSKYIDDKGLEIKMLKLMDIMYSEMLMKRGFYYHADRLLENMIIQIESPKEVHRLPNPLWVNRFIQSILNIIYSYTNIFFMFFSSLSVFSLSHLFIISVFANPVERFFYPSAILYLYALMCGIKNILLYIKYHYISLTK